MIDLAGRGDRWAKPRHFPTVLTRDEDAAPRSVESDRFISAYKELLVNGTADREVQFDPIAVAKELILEVDEQGSMSIRIIVFTINSDNGLLQLSEVLRGSDFDDNDVKEHLAMAIYRDVPLYPHDARAAVELERLYNSLLADGLELENGDETTSYVLARPFTVTAAEDSSNDDEDRFSASVQPADLLVRITRQSERERELIEAARVLASLRTGIARLESCLSDTIRDEGAIQRCLTENPYLFGLQYRRVLPKHRLGSEYEMDYALERVGGFVDLVEIEASNHNLFNKSGDPSAALTHAEQQVLDWLEWLEKNPVYAREKLPGLLRPRGLVIIGREYSLSAVQRLKLSRRNATWSDALTVLTFDSLLEQAKNVLEVLEVSVDLGERRPGSP